MKQFSMASSMLTLSGEFYPSGYLFAMVPGLIEAQEVEKDLTRHNVKSDDVILLSPEVVLEKIVPTSAHHGDTMPSIGTESSTVRQYGDLASQGHYGMMIRTQSTDQTEVIMQSLRKVPFSIAERCRFLVIEDLH